jgi:hypothetical protein
MILIDEFHVSVRAPSGHPDRVYVAVHRTLNSPRFQAAVLRALKGVVRQYPSLRPATIVVSR